VGREQQNHPEGNSGFSAATRISLSGRRRPDDALYRRDLSVGIYQFSPTNRGSCSEQSITSGRMFFQGSPVSGTQQRLRRQDEGSRATGDSVGADEFSDGYAIVIRHSSFPLRGSAADAVFWSNRRSRTAERLAARAIDS
jgi:hypothetical protein